MADFIDDLIDWLGARALADADLAETLQQFAARLVEGGIPIARAVIGRGLAHPVVGLASMTWDRESDAVSVNLYPPSLYDTEEIRRSPFTGMTLNKQRRLLADLRDPAERALYPIFEDLAAKGTTGYLAYSVGFDGEDAPWPDHPSGFNGMSASFTTRRFTGFSDADTAAIDRLIKPLALCARVATDRMLVTELMGRYIGRISGRNVLTGQSQRGDGRTIDCALFFSDMRDSVGLSQAMSAADYLETVNQYFDCTAQAVLEHGGEVLKFIGDGVLAIFPFDGATRQPENMCRAALDAARDAFARADHVNATRAQTGVPPIAFGVALHVGDVIYGNVGTEKRLDFTATGPAVGLVSRCEGMTRSLDADVIATEAFAGKCPEPATSLGTHPIRSFGAAVPLFTYPPTAS